MTSRIPAALKWLVEKRKRIDGKIIKTEKEIEDFVSEKQALINKLKQDLEALDHTIGLHEINVNPKKIKPVQPYKRNGHFNHGQLTRLIYKCLSNSDKGRSIDQVTEYLMFNENLEIDTPEDFAYLRMSVRYRLKGLRSYNKLTSHTVEGTLYWKLAN